MTSFRRIGITGGIGSGKSYVARLIQQTYHLPLYDSDSQARRLMTTSPDIRRQLCALLGNDAYLSDGSLNRPLVARFLFSSEENAARINAIVHPVVRQDWLRFARDAASPVLIESAILIESGLADTVDAIVAVTAPEALRIQRAMARDGSTEQQVRARIARQMTDDELLGHAHHVIVNDGRPLQPQIQKIETTLNP